MQATLLIVFIFGLIIGSFLNVVILRHNTGHSLAGRSGCMSCGHELRWWELFPLLSFGLLRGRCSNCGSKISIQYPIVEFVTATLFVLVFTQSFDLLHLVLGLLISIILVIIATYDTKHTIIPNAYVYTFALLSILFNAPEIGVSTIIAGVVLATPFALLWVVSKGKWIGLGDAKLMLGIGFMLGIFGGFFALTIGSVLGAVIALTYVAIVGKKGAMHLEIPYGPFLIFGFFAVWLLHLDVVYLNLIMS